jgi:hypothetical protein
MFCWQQCSCLSSLYSPMLEGFKGLRERKKVIHTLKCLPNALYVRKSLPILFVTLVPLQQIKSCSLYLQCKIYLVTSITLRTYIEAQLEYSCLKIFCIQLPKIVFFHKPFACGISRVTRCSV